MSVELLDAARSGNLYKIQSLLGSGANINFQNKDQDTALHIATLNGNKDIVNFLIGRGASVNAVNRYYETPLHKAVIRGNLDIIQTLIKAGTNIESRNYLGYTPLHTAILVGRSNELAYALIEQGCDLRTSNNAGESLIHTAAREGNVDMVIYLIEKGLFPDLQDNEGNRPLHVAASRKNTLKRDATQIVATLLEKGANIHSTNLHQQTALHCAAFSGELRTVALLCEHGSSILAKDKRGWLPSHIALGANALDIEEYLLSQDTHPDNPIVETSNDKAEHTVDILLRATFVESNEQLALLKDTLDILYNNPDFQPILDLAAIHAMGTRRQHKALRIFLANNKDITSISPKGGSNTYYPESHVIIISTAHNHEKLLGTIAHEFTRHAAQFVFRNDLLPYPATDAILEKMYKAAVDHDTRESYLALGIEEKEIQRIVISRTFIFSKASQKLPEYNAGVAHAIALFGSQQVEKFCPSLSNYFSKYFLPLCQQARDSFPLTKFLLPAPHSISLRETFSSIFPIQRISSSAITATVITELVFLAVLAKIGKPKSVDTPPSALQTGYVLERATKIKLSKSLMVLEKLLEKNMLPTALPETILADDLRKLIKAFTELYTNGISRDIKLPTRKALKQVITHWQDGFSRLNPRFAQPTLLEKLAARYFPQMLSVKKPARSNNIRLSESFSLSGLLEEVKYPQPNMEKPTTTQPNKVSYSPVGQQDEKSDTQKENELA